MKNQFLAGKPLHFHYALVLQMIDQFFKRMEVLSLLEKNFPEVNRSLILHSFPNFVLLSHLVGISSQKNHKLIQQKFQEIWKLDYISNCTPLKLPILLPEPPKFMIPDLHLFSSQLSEEVVFRTFPLYEGDRVLNIYHPLFVTKRIVKKLDEVNIRLWYKVLQSYEKGLIYFALNKVNFFTQTIDQHLADELSQKYSWTKEQRQEAEDYFKKLAQALVSYKIDQSLRIYELKKSNKFYSKIEYVVQKVKPKSNIVILQIDESLKVVRMISSKGRLEIAYKDTNTPKMIEFNYESLHLNLQFMNIEHFYLIGASSNIIKLLNVVLHFRENLSKSITYSIVDDYLWLDLCLLILK